jgi:tetratricopeptide (TPR) repeat protein
MEPKNIDPMGSFELALKVERAKASLAAGDYGEAKSIFSEILDQAHQPGSSISQKQVASAACILMDCHHRLGEISAGDDAAAILVDVGRTSDDPEIIEQAAMGSQVHGLRLLEKSGPQAAETWLAAAVELGRRSDRSDGLLAAVLARAALLNCFKGEDREAAWSAGLAEVAELARRSSDPTALNYAAGCAIQAGYIARGAGDWKQAQNRFRLAILLGGESHSPEGLILGASAAGRLAADLLAKGSKWRVRKYLRLIDTFTRSADTPSGLDVAAGVHLLLATTRAKGEAALASYREAMQLGRASGTPVALEIVAAAAVNAAGLIKQERQPEARTFLTEAIEAGRVSNRPQALYYASIAAGNLADMHAYAGEFEAAEERFREAIKLASTSGTADATKSIPLLEKALKDTIEERSDTPKIRKGVVVIHGMGEPKRNALLQAVVNQVAYWLSTNVPVHGLFRKPVPFDLTHEDGRSLVSIHHGTQHWIFTEAFWANRIRVPQFTPTVKWTAIRFANHLGRLAKHALFKALLPTILGVIQLMAHLVYAVAMMPFLLLILPIAPGLISVIRAWLNWLYVVFILMIPEIEDPDSQCEVAHAAMRRWRSIGPNAFAAVSCLLGGMAVFAIAKFIPLSDRTFWAVLAYVLLGTFLMARTVADRLAVDPVNADGMSAAMFEAMGSPPTKSRFLRLRLLKLRSFAVYRDVFHNLITAPGTAVVLSLQRWLRANDETVLLRYVDWNLAFPETAERLALGLVLSALIVFRLLHSVMSVCLYALGAAIIFPLMFALWVFSQSAAIRVMPRIITLVKTWLDNLLLGSLGDIKVYMDDDAQAANARVELEEAIDELSKRCDEIHIIAHSLGSAVSYETLVSAGNQVRILKVKSLVTVGAILPMLWRISPHRTSFDQPLPAHIRWVNLWARFDPADSGPIDRQTLERAKPDAPQETRPLGISTFFLFQPLPDPEPGGFKEVIVSNEDDLLRDHTTYWQNFHEVAPQLVRNIWGEGSSDATGNFHRQEGIRAFRQKLLVLCVSGPPLIAWYTFPIAFSLSLVGTSYTGGSPLLHSLFVGLTTLLASHALCWIGKKVFWERSLMNRPVFSACVPPPSQESRVVHIESVGAVEVIGVGAGRHLRV